MNVREYAEYAIRQGAQCWDCSGSLTVADIRHYDHDGGWKVDGFTERQWLYFECPKSRCEYQTSFAKLHIPREGPELPKGGALIVSSEITHKDGFFEAMMKFQYGEGKEVDEGFEEMLRLSTTPPNKSLDSK